MNQNAIALVSTVTVATAVGIVNRVRRPKPETSSRRTKITNTQAIHLLMVELERQLDVNKALSFQNDYLSHMLETHDIPADEFDRIVMNYPFTAEK